MKQLKTIFTMALFCGMVIAMVIPQTCQAQTGMKDTLVVWKFEKKLVVTPDQMDSLYNGMMDWINASYESADPDNPYKSAIVNHDQVRHEVTWEHFWEGDAPRHADGKKWKHMPGGNKYYFATVTMSISSSGMMLVADSVELHWYFPESTWLPWYWFSPRKKWLASGDIPKADLYLALAQEILVNNYNPIGTMFHVAVTPVVKSDDIVVADKSEGVN